MTDKMTKTEARRLVNKLSNTPIAPGQHSHLINVGTESVLDTLDKNYFEYELADGIGCFKYLEGDYGSGKTQFIYSLAERAKKREIVSSIVSVGIDCPFNSPYAIVKSVLESFQLPKRANSDEGTGIEVLLDSWISSKMRQLGAEPGYDVPENVVMQMEEQIGALWRGAPDAQVAAALRMLSKRFLELQCGATDAPIDHEVIAWLRGDNVRSSSLRKNGMFEPLRDDNAFRRLKTVIAFLRLRMGYRGFLIAFDEGSRTSSFRRGTTKQKQAIENLLTMINQNAEGEFGGVMFLYAATPDFRSEVISNYRALNDRIGSVSYSAGSPLVPLINIEETNSLEVIYQIGEKLRNVFSIAFDITWNTEMQKQNTVTLVEAQVELQFENPKPRFFVYQYCRLLNLQKDSQQEINSEWARDFVLNSEPPSSGEEM